MAVVFLVAGFRRQTSPTATHEDTLRRVALSLGWTFSGGMVHGSMGPRRFTVFARDDGPVLRLAVPGTNWAMRSRRSPHGRATGDDRFDGCYAVDWARTEPPTLHRGARDALVRLCRHGEVNAGPGCVDLQLTTYDTSAATLRQLVGALETVGLAADATPSGAALVGDADEPLALRERAVPLVRVEELDEHALAPLLASESVAVRFDVARRLRHEPTLVALVSGEELSDEQRNVALRHLPIDTVSDLHVVALAGPNSAAWGRFAQVASERAVAATSVAWLAWWMRVYDHDRAPLARWVAQSLAQAPVPGAVPVLLELIRRFLEDEADRRWALSGLERTATIDDVMALREAEAEASGTTRQRLASLVADLQRRSGGARGELAIAESTPGAVSVADPPHAARGRLAQAEKPS